MSDISIRIEGRAGRITLQRPDALNALTYQMCLDIEAALDRWIDDDAVALVLIDAVGEKAFCAGGDLAQMYRSGMAGDFSYGRRFWTDEYRLNARIRGYPKPYVALMQGFTMGGGVGVSCHGSHRIVCESSRIAMPECGIGLIPDVGGSLILAGAPGHMGEYVGTTGYRMGAGDAIWMRFADTYVPKDQWPGLVTELQATGSVDCLADYARDAIPGDLPGMTGVVDSVFGADNPAETLAEDESNWAAATRLALARQSPLSVACCIEVVRRVRADLTMEAALRREYRYTYRCMEFGDFLEGIRALIIDKDRKPQWRNNDLAAVKQEIVDAMLAPLGAEELDLGGSGR